MASSHTSRFFAVYWSASVSGRWMRRSARPSSDRPSARRSVSGSGSVGSVEQLQHLAHAARDLPGVEPLRRRVDRQERADALALLDRLELRVGELQLVAEPGDLAGEQRPQPGHHDLLQLVGVEERGVQRAARARR